MELLPRVSSSCLASPGHLLGRGRTDSRVAVPYLITWKCLDVFFPFLLSLGLSFWIRILLGSQGAFSHFQSSVTASFVVSFENQMNSLFLDIFALISKVIHTQRRQLGNTLEVHTHIHTHIHTHMHTHPNSRFPSCSTILRNNHYYFWCKYSLTCTQ